MTDDRLAETTEELAAKVRRFLPLSGLLVPTDSAVDEANASLDSLLARLDAITEQANVNFTAGASSDVEAALWKRRAEAAEADAEKARESGRIIAEDAYRSRGMYERARDDAEALAQAAQDLYERVEMDEAVGICLTDRVPSLRLRAALDARNTS